MNSNMSKGECRGNVVFNCFLSCLGWNGNGAGNIGFDSRRRLHPFYIQLNIK
jgi:hypothetical protein